MQNIENMIAMFRSHGYEPPAEYIWTATHGIIGFAEFSQLEPWHLCFVEEILPLAKRWPTFRAQHEYLPFARRQDRDELACFKLRNGKLDGYCILSYELGPPLHWETLNEYQSFWEWLRSAIGDVEDWCRIRSQTP